MKTSARMSTASPSGRSPACALRPQQGFTLIEMMIVVAVIGILAAIAYPSYIDQLRKGQRTEAKASLMRASQLLERSFTQNGAYPAGAPSLATLYGAAAGTAIYSHPDNPLSATLGKFQVVYAPTVGATAPVAYVLTATPRPAAIADTECPTLGIDSRGRRLVSNALPAAGNRCWR